MIVIVADQLRPFELGCHGGPVRTPHIDALAARGVRFEHAVTNNPVCQPARSCLLSGQHSRSCIGHLGNDSVDTAGKGWGSLAPEFPERERGAHIPGAALPEILAQNGWDTMAVGKWHLRPDPTALGFRHSLIPLNNDRHSGQQHMIDRGEPFPIEGFSVEREAERVHSYLRSRQDEVSDHRLHRFRTWQTWCRGHREPARLASSPLYSYHHHA